MRRVILAVVVSALCASTLTVAVEAQRRGRRAARQPAAPAEAPQSAEISASMGDLRWGMTKDEVLNYFMSKVRERYRQPLAKATDAISEDRIRHQQDEELRRIRESYIVFNGQTTGWDVSFLRDEYTHRNQEAMLVVRDQNSQNFYFFIRGRLWKWYKAFDAAVFEGRPFEDFAQSVQGRFGPAVERSERRENRTARWLEWQDETSRLRAIDNTQFYGFYCLVFEEKATVANLAQLRVNAPNRGPGTHAIVDAVTSGQDTSLDANADIVDRITGHVRVRRDAVDGGVASPPSGAQRQPPATAPRAPERDVLEGVDL